MAAGCVLGYNRALITLNVQTPKVELTDGVHSSTNPTLDVRRIFFLAHLFPGLSLRILHISGGVDELTLVHSDRVRAAIRAAPYKDYRRALVLAAGVTPRTLFLRVVFFLAPLVADR